MLLYSNILIRVSDNFEKYAFPISNQVWMVINDKPKHVGSQGPLSFHISNDRPAHKLKINFLFAFQSHCVTGYGVIIAEM